MTQYITIHPGINIGLQYIRNTDEYIPKLQLHQQKGHFRIEVCQNTIDGHEMRCIYLSTRLLHYFSKCGLAYATISIENSRTVRGYLHCNPRTLAYTGFL